MYKFIYTNTPTHTHLNIRINKGAFIGHLTFKKMKEKKAKQV